MKNREAQTINEIFFRWPLPEKKDESRAEKARLEGNELYKKKKLKEALKCYNESVLFAECKDKQVTYLKVKT